jgi:hypothetical protein
MRRRLLLPAFLIAAFAPLAEAQQATVEQIPDQPPQPVQQPRPAAPKPKPKPAAVKKPASAPAAPDLKAKLLEKIKDWTVFIYDAADGRVCFAATAPSDMQPKAVKRTPVIFYVTTWQKDGIHNEISVKLGYVLKANAVATVTVGNQSFALAADDDKVFAKDPADERRLLAAMVGGGPMTVKAISAKGVATTDHYSLDGASAAVQKAQETCP